MSWRVEHANPFALARELPEELVQTCLVRVPRDLPESCLRALLSEIHRVVRGDGTLWVASQGAPSARVNVALEAGWLLPDDDLAAGRRYRCGALGGRLTLFAKRPEFYFNPQVPLLASVVRCQGHSVAGPRRRLGVSHERRSWCVPSAGRGLSPAVIRWCIHASTAPCACAVCGAAWRRFPGATTPERRWRPGCAHDNGRGRCLLLDPLCGVADVGVLAVRLGRGFLGIEPNFDTALRAAARMSSSQSGARQ
jgi:hypothetical protein